MGNKILGKRSRSFYRGFNERQITYLKEKFQTFSKNGAIQKELFLEAYKMKANLYDAFLKEIDFDEGGNIQQYQFICFISYFCNLSTEELGQKIFQMITNNSKQTFLKEADIESFTSMCLLYNAYINKTPEVNAAQIKKINKKKFQKYDFDKSKTIEEGQFCKICMKDQDYKEWLYNMGFVTKKQLEFQDQIYDLVDSDVGEEVDRHLNQTNPNMDRVKRGIQHRMQGDNQFQLQQVVGDQYTPVERPWQKDTKAIKKQDFDKDIKICQSAPSQQLSLQYILGYRSFDCRNNLKFDSKDRIIYHQAAIGIVMTQQANKTQNQPQFQQSFINQHKDDISCLDIFGNTVVTGEVGSQPMIILWDTEKKDNELHSNLMITKGLKNSVGNVRFSSSGKLLAATCNDEDHTLVIYSLEELRELKADLCSSKTGIVASGLLTKSLVFDVKFSPDQKTLVAATVRDLLFISFDKGVINSSRADFGTFSSSMALCLLQSKINHKGKKIDVIVSGMGNGSVYIWENGKCIKAIVGHSGSVSALCRTSDAKSFISGDKSGKVISWNDKLQKQHQINLKTLNPNVSSHMVVALAQNSKKQLLMGTKSSNVYLLKLGENIEKAKVVMAGHHQGTLWAMAINRKEPFLYTGGQDQRLLKWEYVNSKKLIKEVKTPYKIRSLDYNQFNKMLLVGFYNGVIQCYNSDTLEKYQKLCFNKIKNPDEQTLNIVKFEYYGKYFGVCYSMPKFKFCLMTIVNDKEIKLMAQIPFTQKIISFDFSKSNKDNQEKFMRCNTSGGRYEIYNISKEKPQKVDNKNKKFLNLSWSSHTLAFSPQTKGIFTQGVQQDDITCLARNEFYSNVMVVGDKYSKIKLFNYPNLSNIIYNKYQGHSNAITAMQFDNKKEHKYLISLGGQEKSIMIWKYDPVLTENQLLEELNMVDPDEQLLNQKNKAVKKINNNESDDQGPEIAKGDQAQATDHFKGQIKNPSSFVPNPKKDNVPPKADMQIHHVFGIRNKYLADEVRNHGKFSKNCKSILFPTACMGIKMQIQSKQQTIFLQHKQDIVSFAIDKKRQIMATGQMAQKNLANPLKKILTICVWDIENKKLLQSLKGFHTIAIVLLQFSPSGQLLFSCGNDQKNTYAVYDWKAGSILYSGPISKGKVNGISWRNQTQFATCGNDHVKFWSQGKGQMGAFDKRKTEAQLSCLSSSDSVYITGGAGGNIYNWSGGNGVPISAHKGKVQCLYKNDYFIFSGGDDGLIKKWKKQKNGSIKNCDLFVDIRGAFSNQKLTLNQQQFSILSIDCATKDSQQMLFLTKGCSAIYYNKNKFKIITQGHYKGQLWALATNPTQPCFVTGGDDKTVRYWDIQTKEELKRVNFQNKVRALDWSNDGKKIVIADSHAAIKYYDKELNLLQEYTGQPFKNNQPKKGSTGVQLQGWVQEIKFSPDNNYIAYGTHGQSRTMEYLKAQDRKIAKHKSFTAGTSAVLHVDWSMNSDSISINTQAHQLLFFDINGKSVSASALKDERWATWTQKFGFPVQGIFQGVDYTDINTVCRDPSSQFIAVGYDDQVIRLFKYPCYIPKQQCKAFYGHSSHVTRIKFCQNYMVSLGGQDKTIIVWKYQNFNMKSKALNNEQAQESDGLSDFDDDVDIPSKIIQKRNAKKKVVQAQFYEDQDQGDQFMAVKPWLGAIKEPTYEFPKQSIKAPTSSVQLQYVQGYRTKDCRQNLYYLDSKTIIYHAAAVLIYHNITNNTQTLFTDHNDDILSIDYNRETNGVLTGQLGPNPIVNYYQNSKLVHSFLAPVKKGVLAIAISPEGSFGVCAGMDDDHVVTVLDLKKGSIVSSKKGGKKVILKLGWLNQNQFVSIGIKHFKHWSISGKGLTDKDSNTKEVLVSLGIGKINGNKICLSGSSGGKIYNLNPGNIKLVKTLTKLIKGKPQQQTCSVVQSLKIHDQFIAAGTKDGYLCVLNKSYEVLNHINLQTKLQQFGLSSYHPSIRSIDFLDNKLLIGTFGAQIFEIHANKVMKLGEEKVISKITNHMQCHYSPNNTWTNEVWGLHVSGDYIFSCSDDATLRCWSIKNRKILGSVSLNIGYDENTKKTFQLQKDKKTNDFVQGSKGRSVCISPDRKHIVVGSKDGKVRIFNFDQKTGNMSYKLTFKHAKEWISDIKFGYNTLVIGSHDNAIYVYDYDEEKDQYKRKYKPLNKHSSYITHLDISRDSCYLQSTCGAYQLLFWDLNTGKQLTSGASMLKDQRWATWTSNLGWPVQGIYPKCTDGTFIHSVDRSNTNVRGQTHKTDPVNHYLLAGGNNNGKICLYNYPCTIKNSNFTQGKGHSSHITNVRWNETDEYVISVGGEDQCVMYWKVSKSAK